MIHYLLLCSWHELWRRKVRCIVTIAGYAFIVALALIMSSILGSSTTTTTAILSSTGTHFMVYIPDSAAVNSNPGGLSEAFIVNSIPTRLLSPDTLAALRSISSIKAAGKFLSYRFFDSQFNRLYLIGGFEVENADAVAATCCADGDIIAGRFLTTQDNCSAMVHESFASTYGISVGDTLDIAGQTLIVVGIINPGVRPAYADVYIPLCLAQRIIQSHRQGTTSIAGYANAVLIEVTSSTVQKNAIDEVKALGLTVCTYACYKPAAAVVGMDAAMQWTLLSMLCLGIVLFAMKSQLSVVMEQRREIGVLRAVGWPDSYIIMIQVTSAVFQSSVGALAGIFSAMGILEMVPPKLLYLLTQGQSIFVTIPAALVALFLSIVAGVCAGAIPAFAACRIKPSEAFRRL
ncbi:MAG: ABC transporter permease [Chitinivibrionales bacterium]|nr:ABC transporter permease [Chitinivibrionales bacterium]